ncbi:hypothetical protein B0H13DRAFT_2269519 [Mycena leptocephala]|nr:hypothetical protein B0H13DRAFT_2269519 [Mycena leptocephala]
MLGCFSAVFQKLCLNLACISAICGPPGAPIDTSTPGTSFYGSRGFMKIGSARKTCLDGRMFNFRPSLAMFTTGFDIAADPDKKTPNLQYRLPATTIPVNQVHTRRRDLRNDSSVTVGAGLLYRCRSRESIRPLTLSGVSLSTEHRDFQALLASSSILTRRYRGSHRGRVLEDGTSRSECPPTRTVDWFVWDGERPPLPQFSGTEN